MQNTTTIKYQYKNLLTLEIVITITTTTAARAKLNVCEKNTDCQIDILNLHVFWRFQREIRKSRYWQRTTFFFLKKWFWHNSDHMS